MATARLATVPGVLAALFIAVGACGAGEKIPAGPDALTMTEVSALWLAFYRENTVDAFKRQAYDDEPWRDEALALLEIAIQWYADAPIAPARDEFIDAWSKVKRAGCDDPLVLYAGVRLSMYRDPEDLTKLDDPLVKALEGLKSCDYPPNHEALIAGRLARIYRQTDRDDEAAKLEDVIVGAWARTIETGVYGPDQQRLLLRHVRRAFERALTPDAMERLCRRVEQIPDADPWLVQSLYGFHHKDAAWDARTGKAARDVTEEGWESFYRHLKLAREHLVRAYELKPDRPEPAECMIQVSMGLGDLNEEGENPRYWFDRAVAAQFDWEMAYLAHLFSLRPRWGGTQEAIFQFGTECLQTGRYDTLVPSMFVEALLTIVDDNPSARGSLGDSTIFSAAMNALQGLIEHPHHTRDNGYFRWIQITIAWIAGEIEWGARLLAIRTHPLEVRDVEERLYVRQREVMDDLRLYGSAVADTVGRADDAFYDEDYAAAHGLFTQALEQCEEPLVRTALAHRQETARIAAEFRTGQWVALTPKEGLPGWRIHGGKWGKVGARKESIHSRTSENGYLLINEAPIGRRFEIEGEFDMSGMTYKNLTHVGVIFGYSDTIKEDEWRAVLFYRGEKKIVGRSTRTEGPSSPAPVEPRSRFRVRVWDDEVVAYVNGELAYTATLPAHEVLYPGDRFGIGGRYWYDNGKAFYHDLRLRRLDERPSELPSAPPAQGNGGS